MSLGRQQPPGRLAKRNSGLRSGEVGAKSSQLDPSKNMKISILMLIVCGLLAGGCASDKEGSSGGSAKAEKPSEKNPEVGMTKDQVIAMYGKTDNMAVSSEGEIWTYNLNMGEQFIPFNFGYRPKMRIIHFDKEGKVTNWSYSK